ncbi:patatin-like phospholipase family protein [Ramlibacter sp.]|uniref:patatin-like phospholipase family protein n=1 Tax=Ramlibacter sp. TaxID=1917967 RepID=UPI0017BB9E5F|nr:patatin-like phospholipase family protein [Ramlibacter sp.]MBA2674354.1 patatin-like phospholipase family protein [Ramlibacter sp.]
MTVVEKAVATPQDCIRERRQALQAQDIRLEHERPWGLALSGGGIRSATFCFGLIKALAEKGLFHKFDLMSTVSGGGYIGSTIGQLFNERRQADADPREVEEALKEAETRVFAAWLRANGRYLIPGGAKDLFFAAASYGRNLLAVHFELAMLSFLLGGVLVGLDLLAWQWGDSVFRHARASDAGALAYEVLGSIDWIPATWLLLPLLMWLGLLFTSAFWAAPKKKSDPFGWPRPAVTLLFAATLGVVVISNLPFFAKGDTGYAVEGSMKWPMLVLVALFLAAAVLGHVLAVGLALVRDRDVDWIRNRLTSALSFVLSLAVGLVVLGGVDHLAWALATTDAAKQGTLAIVMVSIAAVLRVVLPRVADVPRGLTPRLRGALMSVMNAAGLLLLLMVVVFWISLEHRAVSGVLFDEGAKHLQFGLAWKWLGWMVAPPLVMVVLSARNREFLNRSSLHSFYHSRLIRSYLGAANRNRFGTDAQRVADTLAKVRDVTAVARVGDVDAGDDVPMVDYAPHLAGGPVHLVNVCVNQTSDPNGGLFNQDRKGLLMTVGPRGASCVSAGTWAAPEPEAALTLGSWVAISGAAVSPGLGASTRPGVAAILMLAGVRLGYWWDSGGLAGPAAKATGKYSGFIDELRGRFSGISRREWFLSDGGHFENTAAYALLREECEVIVVADCGADPRYAFADLENLVRKARIDLQADITFLRTSAPGAAPKAFGSLNEIASEDSQACIAVARVDYRHSKKQGWMFIVKPNLCQGLPVDLVNFKADNPLFPQEPTTDQSFSEAQWESYFQLGDTLGRQLDDKQLGAAQAFASNFVDDDGAFFVRDADGTPVLKAPQKRLSSRIASTGAVTATLGLGGVASLGIAAWEGVNAELRSHTLASQIEPAAYKELTEIFGKLPVEPVSAAAPAKSADGRLGEMATALLRVGDAACTSDNMGAFRESNLMALMIQRTKDACRESTPKHPSCEALLQDDRISACLQDKPRVSCIPVYWGRHYGQGPSKPANCWDPETAIVAAAAAPPTAAGPAAPAVSTRTTGAQSPASAVQGTVQVVAARPEPNPDACAGHTIYIQIYGPELRDKARMLRAPWRALGASVPPVEDVWDTARRAGRRAPQPYAVPTVLYRNAASLQCAEALAPPGAVQAWAVKPLRAQSDASSTVIEVWLPPLPPQIGALSATAFCYQEDDGVQSPSRFGASCFPTEVQCVEGRGNHPRRRMSECNSVAIDTPVRDKLRPGWSNSWFLQQSSPMASPMPQLPG